MDLIKKKESHIVCPENRIYEYLLFSDYIFNQSKVTFSNDFKKIDKKNVQIFLDIKFINQFLNYDFQNIPSEIFCILWNGHIDFLINEEKLILAKKKFNKFTLLGPCNLLIKNKKYLTLNSFQVSHNSILRDIKGINLIKKIKYIYPSVFSIYNFCKNLPRTLNFLDQKLIFVGLGNKDDVYNQIKYILNSKFTTANFKVWAKIISSRFLEKKKIFKLDCLEQVYDFKMNLDEKYYALNIIIRYLLLDYLKNLKFFYHKTNSNDALELLKTNFYKKVFQLNLGSQHGNGEVNARSILLKKFYKGREINLSFFKPNIQYNEEKLYNRIKIIKYFFVELYKLENFNIDIEYFLKKIIMINKILDE